MSEGKKIKTTGGTLVISPPEVIRKEYIDFNKVNWNTREVEFDDHRNRIKYSVENRLNMYNKNLYKNQAVLSYDTAQIVGNLHGVFK